MPAKRTNSPSTTKKSDKRYDKVEKTSERATTINPHVSTPPNWQAHCPEWSTDRPKYKNANLSIDKWCLLPPYDHSITEEQWELYHKERSALDELNTIGSEASKPIRPSELRPPLRVLEDSAADAAAAIYGSVLAEESKLAIARTLRGSIYITAADGMEGCFSVNTRLYSPFGIGTSVDFAYSYSFDYRESDFFGLLTAKSNKVSAIDAENPSRCKALQEDGSPMPGSVEIFSWYGGNQVGAATAAEFSSFEPALFGSTGWLSPLKLHNLLFAASTCSQYDDCYQELKSDIVVASSKKLKFFEGETPGGKLSDAENVLYRKLREHMLSGKAEPCKVGSVRDLTIPGAPPVNVRVFTPPGDVPTSGWPVLTYYHGGGWMLGNIDAENSFSARTCLTAKCVVVLVDYRLAPEHVFPAAVDDSWAALEWIHEHGATELGINPSKIAVGGSSAGGNLSAVMTQRAAQRIPPLPIIYQLLIVPVTDNTVQEDGSSLLPTHHESWVKWKNTTPLIPKEMLWFRSYYLPDKSKWAHVDASPLLQKDAGVWSKLPNAWVGLAELDILRSEGEAYARRLEEAGRQVEFVVYPGAPHSIIIMDKATKIGFQLGEDAAQALHRAFYNS
ncbi:unnamed protein product [Rhizoctonia solani]|uniref:Alpha/beta hydrolase fold-3 domain-containing protein n=1 Tax=Rhizoctonia solani TaxID=456999 RepID=A0A8H3E2U0_9AGAM|nr:unnamed protein product [Rhizoctonia solani]